MSLDDDFDLMSDDFSDSDGFGDGIGFEDASFGDDSGLGDEIGVDASDFGGSSSTKSITRSMNQAGNNANSGASDGDDFELEFEDTDDDFLDGEAQYTDTRDPLEAPETETIEKKRTALLAIGLGFGVLLVVLILARVLITYKKAQNNVGKQPSTTVSTEYKYKDEENNEKMPETSAPVVKSYTGEEGWVQITKDTSISEGIVSDGVFTVTDVVHYAKLANAKNDKQLKSIVSGNISGLVGTFEFEVPFSKAKKLSDGMSFSIKYSISENNGYKVIQVVDY